MRLHRGSLLFSASDLGNFLECEHLTALDLQSLLHPECSPKRGEADLQVELIRAHGQLHEDRYLQSLRDSGRQVADLRDVPGGLEEAVAATTAAMRRGDEVIYQAALMHAPFSGFADFLIRVPGASSLGAWHYEVADTKLARSPKSKFLIQLCFYAELIAKIQGIAPSQVHLYFGDGSERSYRTADYSAYFSMVCERYLNFIGALQEKQSTATYPEPISHCALCAWSEACGKRWVEDDHLSQVANITHSQIQRLGAGGVTTLEGLASLPDGAPVADLNPVVLAKLMHQANLQLNKRRTGENQVELLEVDQERGFARLPIPDQGDLFFDMEGDPFEEGGLEYLFGVGVAVDGQFRFHDFWAHNRAEERRAFEAFIDFVTNHLRTHPAAHIYHYAPYETTSIKRLMSFHGTREAEVDSLLRRGKLIDLYKVVREGIRVSEPRYSIKNLETFYAEKRSGEVKDAGSSIVWYERWKETGDPQLLEAIRSYNEDDCRSTWQLHQWLLGLRPKDLPWHSASVPETADPEGERKPWETRLATYREAMLGSLPADPTTWDDEARMRELAYQLLDFHRREAKPQWWAMFARMELPEEELMEDIECLAGLILDPSRPPRPEKRSTIQTYRYPEQETKLRTGSSVTEASSGRPLGEFTLFDEDRRVELKVGPTKTLPARLSLGPGQPINSEVMQVALTRFADSVIAGDHRFQGLESILRRSYPSLRGRRQGDPILPGSASLLAEVVEATDALESSHLFIQGPPGAGKTWTGSRIIVEMLRRGKRVAVASNSHKAIHNILAAVEKVAIEDGFSFKGAKKSNGNDPDSKFQGQFIRNVDSAGDVAADDRLVAGTAWLFSRPEFELSFDLLFVDEAGQVALANLIAMGTCAHNHVLLGDPMQLGQPTQGTHPGCSGESGLEFLLNGGATVAPERGVFLPTTWRMAPALCQFISEAVYDGRLEPESSNYHQKLVLGAIADPMLKADGIRFLPIEHYGNSQRSVEEADRISTLIESLLQQEFCDRFGNQRAVALDDILVVAPYNLQVNLLKQRLPAGARVGTVDKFQGQEAPVVIVSMATSSEDDLPRDIGFLFSKNRLNVAISRAQCLAVVVASPRLLTVNCSTVEQMALVNLMCWIAQVGG